MNHETESAVRHALQFLFAQLVAYGYVEASDVALYVGLSMSVITGVWGIYRTRSARKKSNAAVQVAVEAISSPQLVQPEEQRLAESIIANKIDAIIKNGKH